MMDGRNSSGRTVSLLIDSPSHPSPQPQTPPLVRSASSDSSSDSRTFASPSPLTPHSTSFFPSHAQKHPPQSLHHAHGPHAPQQAYYLYRQPSWSSQKMDDQALYPGLLPDSTITGFPLPNQPMPQARMRNSTSPISESHRSIASATSVHQQKTAKKNQYPCPLARQYQCNDHFTTSGHAARHAKKHTGRKDAICPECNKAFTRKDNMEQHRRTHQNVRGPAKGSSSENRVKKPSKASRKGDKADKSGSVAASVATPTFEAAVHAQLEEQQQVQQMPLPDAAHFVLPTDPQLQQTLIAGGPGPYFMSADPIAALPQPMQIPADFVGGVARPQLYRSGYTNTLDFSTIPLPPTLGDGDLQFSYPSPGLSNGLNTLALAASGHRRLSEPNERRPQAERIDSEASSTKSSAATP